MEISYEYKELALDLYRFEVRNLWHSIFLLLLREALYKDRLIVLRYTAQLIASSITALCKL